MEWLRSEMSGEKERHERRLFRRLPVAAVVRYAPRLIAGHVPADLLEGQALNLSRSGVALELDHYLRPGGMVELAMMRLTPMFCINVVGRVVRSNPFPATVGPSPKGVRNPRYEVALEFARVLTLPEVEEFERNGGGREAGGPSAAFG
jgi:hypothetical protein